MDVWVRKSKAKKTTSMQPNILWEKLRDPKVHQVFREKTDEKVCASDWPKIMQEVSSVGKEAYAVKKKVNLCPWLEEKADEIKDFQDQLRGLTEEIRTSDHPEQVHAVRRRVRKKYRKLRILGKKSSG